MYSNEYEILTAVKNGELKKFHDKWPPDNTLVDKDCFDRLNRENLIHAPINVSSCDGWGYIDVTLNSSGISLLEKLENERTELSFLEKLKKFTKEHVIASVSIGALVSAAAIVLVQESVKSLFK